MSQENVERLKAVYASWARGDFSASLPLFAEGIVLIVDAEIPDGGTSVGVDGVRDYMSRFLDPWDSLSISGEAFDEAGDRVLVSVRQSGIGRSSGVPVELRYFQLWTFGGDRVIRLEVIFSERRARQAAGLVG
jgi:ketosteroid isomerase-like protein